MKIYDFAYSKEIITVDSVKTLDADILDRTVNGNIVPCSVTISVLDGDLRFWVDGSTPTSSEGLLAVENSTFSLYGELSLKKAKFINSSATVTLNVQYFTDRALGLI